MKACGRILVNAVGAEDSEKAFSKSLGRSCSQADNTADLMDSDKLGRHGSDASAFLR